MVRRPMGQRAIGKVIKTHSAVGAQQHPMLHHRGGCNAGPCCGGARGLLGSNWTLRRMFFEVCRRADSPRPPQKRGAHLGSHATDAASTESDIRPGQQGNPQKRTDQLSKRKRNIRLVNIKIPKPPSCRYRNTVAPFHTVLLSQFFRVRLLRNSHSLPPCLSRNSTPSTT